MATINFTIASPILTAGASFTVRYRMLPSGSFSAPVSETSNTFSITGLTAGANYELEVTYVKADGTFCDPVVTPFSVAADFTCIDTFAAAIQKVNSNFIIHLTYTIPGGFTDPPCGWDFIYTINGKDTTVHYATLPSGGVINISLPSNSTLVFRARANLCNNKSIDCYSADLSPASDPCTPLIVKQTDLVYTNYPAPAYNIRILFDPSTIPTKPLKINYTETSPNMNGKPPDTGTYSQLSGVTACNVPVNPHGVPTCLRYVGNFIDECGKNHTFCVFYPNNPDICGCAS